MPKWRAFDEGGLTEGISGSILGLAMTPALSFVMTRVSSWLGPAQRRPQAMRWPAFRQFKNKVGEAIADFAHYPTTLSLLVTGYDSARPVPLLQFGRSECDCDYYDDQKDGL